jgi:hypothetical protein
VTNQWRFNLNNDVSLFSDAESSESNDWNCGHRPNQFGYGMNRDSNCDGWYDEGGEWSDVDKEEVERLKQKPRSSNYRAVSVESLEWMFQTLSDHIEASVSQEGKEQVEASLKFIRDEAIPAHANRNWVEDQKWYSGSTTTYYTEQFQDQGLGCLQLSCQDQTEEALNAALREEISYLKQKLDEDHDYYADKEIEYESDLVHLRDNVERLEGSLKRLWIRDLLLVPKKDP